MMAILALTQGRLSSRGLMSICCAWAAFSPACNAYAVTHWLPSVHNPDDAPSMAAGVGGPPSGLGGDGDEKVEPGAATSSADRIGLGSSGLYRQPPSAMPPAPRQQPA